MKRADLSLALLAVVLFTPLFAVRTVGPLDFWWWMSADVAVLVAFSFILDREYRAVVFSDLASGKAKKIGLGILSALLLYAVFSCGNWAAPRILSFARADISEVYSFKGGASVLKIVLLLVFIIGPGEELFWRGFLQRRLQDRLGRSAGYLLATGLYTLVHLGTGNLSLLGAAAICGAAWGFLYSRCRSVLLVAVSHVLWDLMVFVLFPFKG